MIDVNFSNYSYFDIIATFVCVVMAYLLYLYGSYIEKKSKIEPISKPKRSYHRFTKDELVLLRSHLSDEDVSRAINVSVYSVHKKRQRMNYENGIN